MVSEVKPCSRRRGAVLLPTANHLNQMSSIKGSRTQQLPRGAAEESEGGSKPLAAALFQEIQNLKDKFKNEDDAQERGA